MYHLYDIEPACFLCVMCRSFIVSNLFLCSQSTKRLVRLFNYYCVLGSFFLIASRIHYNMDQITVSVCIRARTSSTDLELCLFLSICLIAFFIISFQSNNQSSCMPHVASQADAIIPVLHCLFKMHHIFSLSHAYYFGYSTR